MGARPVCEGRADGAPPCPACQELTCWLLFFFKKAQIKNRLDFSLFFFSNHHRLPGTFWVMLQPSEAPVDNLIPPLPVWSGRGEMQPFCRGFPAGLNRLHRAPDRAPGSRRLAARRASWNTEPSLLPSYIWPEFELDCASAPGPITVMRGLGRGGGRRCHGRAWKRFHLLWPTQLLIIFHVSVGARFIGTLLFDSHREPRWRSSIQFWITGVCSLLKAPPRRLCKCYIPLGEKRVRRSVMYVFRGRKKKKKKRGVERNTSGILASLWINVHSVKKIKLNKYH